MKTITKFIDCLKLNIDFIIGSNAQDNHNIIDDADPEDIWFHISDRPSCHVICKIPTDVEINKKALLKIVKQGAVVCKENSGYNKEKNVEIDYTFIKNVTKLDKPGAVTIINAKKIII
jgi:predicted ribosome quality control (RQC) complex YloA/Tae2 family protein